MNQPVKLSSRLALYGAGSVFGALTAIAAFVSTAGAWPLAVLSLACFAIANLDQFAEISAGSSGITAVLREARTEVSAMREVVELMSEFQLALMQQMGRWDPGDDDQKLSFLTRVTDLMRKAGVPDERIWEIRSRVWDRYVHFDYVYSILGGSYVPKSDDRDLNARWKELRDFDHIPSPVDLTQFLDEIGDDNPVRRRLLHAYEQYLQNGQHPDLDLWAKRDEVPQLLGDMARKRK